MTDNIDWKDVPKLAFDPNVEYEVEFAFDSYRGPYDGKYGEFVVWGILVGGDPYIISTGKKSGLIQLLEERGIEKGDKVTIMAKQKGDEKKRTYVVDGKELDPKEPPKSPGKSGDRFQELMKSMTEIHMKLDTILDEIKGSVPEPESEPVSEEDDLPW